MLCQFLVIFLKGQLKHYSIYVQLKTIYQGIGCDKQLGHKEKSLPEDGPFKIGNIQSTDLKLYSNSLFENKKLSNCVYFTIFQMPNQCKKLFVGVQFSKMFPVSRVGPWTSPILPTLSPPLAGAQNGPVSLQGLIFQIIFKSIYNLILFYINVLGRVALAFNM